MINSSSTRSLATLVNTKELKLFGENKLVGSVKLLLLGMKSINLIQKYPHVIES